MKISLTKIIILSFVIIIVGAIVYSYSLAQKNIMSGSKEVQDLITTNATQMLEEGRETFRYETFGDEAFWGDALQLHKAIAGEKNGGVGDGVSPKTALSVGLKVDMDAIPTDVAEAIKSGKVNLDDPAVTITLLKLNAVVGLKGIFEDNKIKSIGLTCASCHSTVDDAFAPGIGNRLDGWANRDLNVGAIISLAPNLKPVTDLLNVDEATLKQVLSKWGPGRFSAVVFLDGKAMRPNGSVAVSLIPPAYGLAGVNLSTYNGWGNITYWNALVANLEMHGKGTFFDSRLNDSEKFPIAAVNDFGNTKNIDDQITSKLAALQFYQLAIPPPSPPENSFDKSASDRGQVLFMNKAKCSSCHVPPLFTEPGWNMHSPDEIGIDDFDAMRSPDGKYRTTPLRGLWAHQKGGFYHDGRFSALIDVVNHYNAVKKLQLTEDEKKDLVEYLKSL